MNIGDGSVGMGGKDGSDYDLKPHQMHLRRHIQLGFVGRCTYDVRLSSYDQRRVAFFDPGDRTSRSAHDNVGADGLDCA